jgi:transposase
LNATAVPEAGLRSNSSLWLRCDGKVLRDFLRLRKQDKDERDEQESSLDLSLSRRWRARAHPKHRRLIPVLAEADSLIPESAEFWLLSGGQEGFAMAAAIGLRDDYDAKALRAAAKRSKDGPQARRLLALAFIYDGATRSEAAKIGGVTLQVVRDWALKFNAQGPDGLIDRKAPGRPPRLNGEHRAALAAILESGPIPAVHGVVRWRIVDLCQWIRDELRVVVSQQTLSGVLRIMGYRKLSARPRHHARAAGAIENFKKVSPRAFKRSGGRRPSILAP